LARIGVFVCHCGENIAATVDCEAVVRRLAEHPGVACAMDYKYMCSDPGQERVRAAIREYRLTGVVVAACSPRMHEPTFRRACAEAGLNAYLCEMANIREQVSWVHDDRAAATDKAVEVIRLLVEKVKRNAELSPIRVPVTRRAMVIGGGIAGIQAALDIANAGHEVVLVERELSIGGHMAQLSETFPTLDCSQCILTPRMVEVAQHPKITLMTFAEVDQVKGFIGNFVVSVRRKARSVDLKKCTGCGVCTTKCPVKKIPSEFDAAIGMRSAIYTPFPQAVPNKPGIDRLRCLKFQKGTCGACAKACPAGAIDYSQHDDIVEVNVGAIVVATGFQVQSADVYAEYGLGQSKDIITSMQFERLASASGPTGGKIVRPSDGREPKTIVFIQCVGSRDAAKGVRYCSKICCMYTAKHTMLYRHKVHDGQASVFYMDIRAAGKGYDEFVRRAIEEDRACYLRGRVSRVYSQGTQLVVKGVDTLSGRPMTIDADMVVLATAVVPQADAVKLAQTVGIGYDGDGFYNEAHPKLRPVETAPAGVMLAGACQGPKDIPESVAQASAAASKVLALFSREELQRDPTVASVNESTCAGCFGCMQACPYGAIEKKEIRAKDGRRIRTVASVIGCVCLGCGTCGAFCRSNSIDLAGFSERQIYAAVMSLKKDEQ